jgi:tetratricopeptide (TPR) repeat protein
MELTLDEALKQGIEAHKAGKIQEAERLYTSILKAQPNHPDANHNMGVLAVGVGKIQKALPFFKAAIEANVSIGQYWLSYIDALTKLDRMTDAKAVFDQAKDKGAKGDAFDQLEQQLAKQKLNESETNTTEIEGLNCSKTNILDTLKLDKALRLAKRKSKEGQLKEANNIYQDILQTFPKNKQGLIGLQLLAGSAKKVPQDPPSNQLQPIINLYTQGQLQNALSETTQMLERFPHSIVLYNIAGASNAGLMQFDAAIACYKQALKIKPDYAEAYNNMGVALKDDVKAAIDSFKKAVKFKPDYAEAYYNMGNVLKDKGDLESAIKSFKKALKIKPDYAEAYSNMGVALQGKGDLEAAIESYKQAINIKPDSAEAYSNMGSALQDKGDSEASIESYKQALKIKPDYAQAWNNLIFPLQVKKLQTSDIEELLSTINPKTGSKYAQIAKSVLSFILRQGGGNAESALNEVFCLLSKADNRIITNSEVTNKESPPQAIGPGNTVALVHFGRSGTGLLHSLIDGHPEVSTLPSIYFSEFFNHSTWDKIVSGGWSNMANRFITNYEVLFDASVQNSIESKSGKLITNIGQKEGMVNVGDQQDEVLRVNKTLFRKELLRLIALHDHLDAFGFFKLAHTAYNMAIKDSNDKGLIFYHIHNPDYYAKLNFVNAAPNANWIMMVREPIQACESWVRSSFHSNKYTDIPTKIITMLFEIDNIIYQKQRSIGLRLEDLKESPRKTIPALCDWMGIKESECLYEMTAQGKKWWGDRSSPDYAEDGMEPFGTTSIKRKVGSVFTENDQFILHTLFYPFSVRFGYVEENLEQFKADLQVIRPMLDEMFGFEITIAERTQADAERLMKSGSYQYLRSCLIKRWNVLATFHTYPNMIKPLNIK